MKKTRKHSFARGIGELQDLLAKKEAAHGQREGNLKTGKGNLTKTHNQETPRKPSQKSRFSWSLLRGTKHQFLRTLGFDG